MKKISLSLFWQRKWKKPSALTHSEQFSFVVSGFSDPWPAGCGRGQMWAVPDVGGARCGRGRWAHRTVKQKERNTTICWPTGRTTDESLLVVEASSSWTKNVSFSVNKWITMKMLAESRKRATLSTVKHILCPKPTREKPHYSSQTHMDVLTSSGTETDPLGLRDHRHVWRKKRDSSRPICEARRW